MVNESSEEPEKFSLLHATLSWHNKSIKREKLHRTLATNHNISPVSSTQTFTAKKN